MFEQLRKALVDAFHELFTDLNEGSLQELSAENSRKTNQVRELRRTMRITLSTVMEVVDFTDSVSLMKKERDERNNSWLYFFFFFFKDKRLLCDEQKDLLKKAQESAAQFQERCAEIIRKCDEREVECDIQITIALEKTTQADTQLIKSMVAVFGMVTLALAASAMTATAGWSALGAIIGGATSASQAYFTREQIQQYATMTARTIIDCKSALKTIRDCAALCSLAAASVYRTIGHVTEGHMRLESLFQTVQELREEIQSAQQQLDTCTIVHVGL